LIRELRQLPDRQRVVITAVCLPAGLAFVLVALIFVIFAFNVIDAGTFAYLGVPIGVLVLSGICGLLGRWLSGRLYPGLLIAGIAALVLSLTAVVWSFLAVAGDVV
jgi:hypothetical protein